MNENSALKYFQTKNINTIMSQKRNFNLLLISGSYLLLPGLVVGIFLRHDKFSEILNYICAAPLICLVAATIYTTLLNRQYLWLSSNSDKVIFAEELIKNMNVDAYCACRLSIVLSEQCIDTDKDLLARLLANHKDKQGSTASP
jgi:hypothetical protein